MGKFAEEMLGRQMREKNMFSLYCLIESKMMYGADKPGLIEEMQESIPEGLAEELDDFAEELFGYGGTGVIGMDCAAANMKFAYLGVSSADILDAAIDPSDVRLESLLAERCDLRRKEAEEARKSELIGKSLSSMEFFRLMEAEKREMELDERRESQPGGMIYNKNLETFINNGLLWQAGIPERILEEPHEVFKLMPALFTMLYTSISTQSLAMARNLVIGGPVQIEMGGFTRDVDAKEFSERIRNDLMVTKGVKDYLVSYISKHGGPAGLTMDARHEGMREVYNGDKRKYVVDSKCLMAISIAMASRAVMQGFGIDDRHPFVSTMKQEAYRNPIYRQAASQMYEAIEMKADEIFGRG